MTNQSVDKSIEKKPTEHILVAGHKGMVGSAIVRQLTNLGCNKIVT